VVRDEIEELVELASLPDDPDALFSSKPCRERRYISSFLQYRPQPLSAVYNLDGDPAANALRRVVAPEPNLLEIYRGEELDARYPVIKTGRELARWFEMETPGLAHRHALNLLLRDKDWSPPRQAWVWAALDVTIYSALLAAWYYKWFAGIEDEACRQSPHGARQGVSFRPRPFELDSRVGVLFNREVSHYGDGDGRYRPNPRPSPGTPRHPSYPSGHSTYAGAASELLSWFFPDYREEFNRLADNAGMARLWAGIHYRSDHLQGMRLGRCIACLVIEDLKKGCIARDPDGCEPPCIPVKRREPCDPPPAPEELCERAQLCAKCCDGEGPGTPELHDMARPAFRSPEAEREQARSPQKGAR
jgi:membrane-associated phospholipid phosphatase